MIAETLARGASYDLGALWAKIYPELLMLVKKGGQLPEGNYLLAGGPDAGGVAAKVEVYSPRQEADCRYESHERMADIQLVLEGDEFMEVFFLHGGEEESLHDAQRDLIFYTAKPQAAAKVHLVPGMFALLMPGEAHKPCMQAESTQVRKLVVKIPAESLKAPAGIDTSL
jgi:YhcH/YjgK/YiaL family protein